jgi:uncharacterized protein (TIGR03437 family)
MVPLAALALSLPLHFEPNRGQSPGEVRYVAATRRYSVALFDTAICVNSPHADSVCMNIPRARVEPAEVLPTAIANYATLWYKSVFPGIDLKIYGSEQDLEYDWIVQPGSDPSAIRFSFTGAAGARVDASGDLVLPLAEGELRHRKPFIYQIERGSTKIVEGGFSVDVSGEVSFHIGPYDRREPLVIDPKLIYSTGFGGSGSYTTIPRLQLSYQDTPTRIAVDRKGNIYIAGTTFSNDFPLVHPLPGTAVPPGCICRYPAGAFVSKLSPDGGTLLYSVAFGRPYPSPFPLGMAVDLDGNVYLTGTTSGADFPQVGGSAATTAGGSDAFLLELDSNGTLVAAVVFGGSGDDAGTSISLGPDGMLYVVGTTASPNFPVSNGALRTAPGGLFLMKINPAELTGNKLPPSAIVYSTYLTSGAGPVIAADAFGSAYIAMSVKDCNSWSATPGVFQSTCAGIILAKMSPAGDKLSYTTYFGGSGNDQERAYGFGADTAAGIALDSAGSVYLTGTTWSTDFPTTPGAFQTAGSPPQAFVAKVSTDATKLLYSTYLPATAQAIAVDAAGNAYVGGSSGSDFPVLDAFQGDLFYGICPEYTPSGATPYAEVECKAPAGFVSVLGPDGSTLRWSTYVGSGSVNALTLDAGGNVYAAGFGINLSRARITGSPGGSIGIAKIAQEGQPLQFRADSIADAASFHPGLPRPGGLASLFVRGLSAAGTITPQGYPLPKELAGVSILVNGIPAPILAIANLPSSDPLGLQQINFQVPFEAAFGANTLPMEVRYQGISTFVQPRLVAPGIFTLPDGSGAVQHASDFSLVTASNPAKKGEVIVVYVTGLGPVDPAVASGVPATAAASFRGECIPPTVDLGKIPTVTSLGKILYAGLTPGFVGLYQINVLVSSSAPSGEADLSILWPECLGPYSSLNYYQSNTVKLAIE